MYRNSQRRFYNETSIYFITTNTQDRFPFFKEDIFCRLFVENLRLCKKLKQFELYAFAILYEHIHLLLYPYGKYNISEIMQNLKRTSSLQINQIMNLHKIEGENIYSRLHVNDLFIQLNKKFIDKYGRDQYLIPPFQWHPSFHDHIIRGEKDFQYHYDYANFNCEKHNICKIAEQYKWSSLNSKFHDFLDPA